MRDYLLLLHDNPAQMGTISPTEMQAIIARYNAWAGALAEQGRLAHGAKLADEGGKHLRRTATGVSAADGPFAEAKEVIGGLFIIKAADYDEAIGLASDCPHLETGWIELREVDPAGDE
jgi:hypothetical protein